MCYKNADKPTCIDLILTNCPGSSQTFSAVETRLSDFHKMIVTVMKTSYRKSQPKIIHYRNYKNLGNSCDQDIDEFLISCSKILDQYAPRKK